MPFYRGWIERRIEDFLEDKRRKPNAVNLLAEGDSWFAYGGWLGGGMSLVELLNKEYRTMNVMSVAQVGAELNEMVEPENREWLLATNPDWLNGHQYQGVLLSAGGNDVVGEELGGLILEFDENKDATEHINAVTLGARRDAFKRQFGSIRHTVDRLIGPVPIFIHGYDYAIPSGKPFQMFGGLIERGPWIRKELLKKKIDNDAWHVVIVNFLINWYNDLLIELADEIDHFHHVDFRNRLGVEHWADEIHPTREGRLILARQLRSRVWEVLG